MNNGACRQVFRDILTGNHVCTKTTPTNSPCRGDSGGPLFLKQTGPKGDYLLQIGIVSFGTITCERYVASRKLPIISNNLKNHNSILTKLWLSYAEVIPWHSLASQHSWITSTKSPEGVCRISCKKSLYQDSVVEAKHKWQLKRSGHSTCTFSWS